jgi:O-antigen/teichoic acid export membrane protein
MSNGASSSPPARQIAGNFAWLMLDRAGQVVFGLLVGIWVARYLGPANLGILGYASALVSILGVVAGLGLRQVAIRELVRRPSESGALVATAAALQLAGGGVAIALVWASLDLLRPDDPLGKAVLAVTSLTLILRAGEVFSYLFEARVEAKYAVLARNAAALASAAVKIGLIIASAPVIWFAWAAVLETALFTAFLLAFYRRIAPKPFLLRPRRQVALELLKDSWPLLLSSAAVILYLRTDQVMLAYLVGDEAVGLYLIPVRLTEFWFVIPTAITASVFPTLIGQRSSNQALYMERLQNLYNLVTLLGVVTAVFLSFAAFGLITLLYGDSFSPAVPVLQVLAWNLVFVAMGAARGPWVLIENLQFYSYLYVVMAMLMNVVLNFVLIPLYGPVGAAIASLAAQVGATVVFPYFVKPTRISAIMLLRSLDPRGWYSALMFASNVFLRRR